MPNTTSAKKALRGAHRKKVHNLFWKKRVKDIIKNIKAHIQSGTALDIIKKEESILYKVVDKAAKEKVIHKNKASRVKSRISKQVLAHADKPIKSTTKKEKSSAERKTARSTTKKSKS